MEDIQETAAPEQVEQQETTLTFGQGQIANTQEGVDNGQVEQEIANWNEDKRFKDHWGEDPNKMYETLRYHEKRQGDYDNLKNEVESLVKYRDDYNALEKLFDHPELGNQLIDVINKYQNPQKSQPMQETVQDNPYQAELAKLNEITQWKEKIENQAYEQAMQQQQQEQFNKIDDFAKQYNIKYDKDEFLSAMQANNIEPNNWVHYFKSQASDVALKNAQNRAAESALKNRSSIPSSVSGNGKSVSGYAGMNVDQALEAILGS